MADDFLELPEWLTQLRRAMQRSIRPERLETAIKAQAEKAANGDLAATRFIVQHCQQLLVNEERRAKNHPANRLRDKVAAGLPISDDEEKRLRNGNGNGRH